MIKIHRFNIQEGNICCCVFLNQSLDSGVLAKQRYIKTDLLSYFFTSHTEKKKRLKRNKRLLTCDKSYHTAVVIFWIRTENNSVHSDNLCSSRITGLQTCPLYSH